MYNLDYNYLIYALYDPIFIDIAQFLSARDVVHENEKRNRSGGWVRNQIETCDHCGLKAIAACLWQVHGLLSFDHADAGQNKGYSDYLYALGPVYEVA